MHEWLLGIWAKLSKTVVLVTHDVDEAILLSDRIYVMTPLPGQVKAEFAIALPRPRRYDVALTQDFLAHKAALLSSLRDGVALAGAS
jgi:ABC-type nitrate/sulfonate/bicarbonate transport system ATPase subunit